MTIAKMTRLQWFEAGHGTKAVELGIISPDVFMKWVRYRVYLDFRAQGHDISTATELAAERHKCSFITIYKDRIFFRADWPQIDLTSPKSVAALKGMRKSACTS